MLSPMRIEELQHAAGRYTSSTGLGTDGFLTKLPLDLTREGRHKSIDTLTKVEQCGLWPEQASTTMFFLCSQKNVTSGSPIASLPTLIRWWSG